MGRRSGSRALACAVALAVVCLPVSGCSLFGDDPAAEPSALGQIDRVPVGSGPLVAVLGDSLTVSIRDALAAAMSDRSLLVAAVSGEGWTGGVFTRDNPGDPPVVAAGLEYAALGPAVSVLALGTNDAWSSELPVQAALDQIDRVAGALGGSCIVAVEIDEDVPEQSAFDTDAARAINEKLRSVAGQVVPWNWAANGGDGLVAEDGIHLTEAGQELRARLTDEAVDRCLES